MSARDLPQSIETPDVMPLGVVESLQRAEIDVQIATAKRYPRSIAQFKATATEMVSMDEETAESCIYRRPVGGGKVAEGMSVRMAEIVASCYGNIRVGTMIIEQTERQVKARGFCHDVQNNVAATVEVVESTIKANGQPYDERMRVVVAKAAAAKAYRDAVFKVVPRGLCKALEEMARQVAIGDATTFTKRRDAVMGWLARIGVDGPRAFAALGIKGVEDIGVEQLVTLTGYKTAIKDGEITVDEAFPPNRREASAPASNPFKNKAAEKAEAPTLSPRAELERQLQELMQLDDVSEAQLKGELAIRHKKPMTIALLSDEELAEILNPTKWAVVVKNINTDPLA